MSEKADEIRHSSPYETAVRLVMGSDLTGNTEDVLIHTEAVAVALKRAYKAGYEKALADTKDALVVIPCE